MGVKRGKGKKGPRVMGEIIIAIALPTGKKPKQVKKKGKKGAKKR